MNEREKQQREREKGGWEEGDQKVWDKGELNPCGSIIGDGSSC